MTGKGWRRESSSSQHHPVSAFACASRASWGARVQITGRPSKVAGDHAPQRLPGSSRSKMRCQRAASPARGPGAAWMPRRPGRSRPPGVRRASARRDLTMPPAPGMVPIAVSTVSDLRVCRPSTVNLLGHGLAHQPSDIAPLMLHRPNERRSGVSTRVCPVRQGRLDVAAEALLVEACARDGCTMPGIPPLPVSSCASRRRP